MNHTNTARVSVIISTFNRPDLLKQAVQSVVAQTLAAQEIIIIDDGSEDIYREKIRRINELNPSVVLFQFQENRGVSQARNFALKKAKGDYILFMDDDDLIHPEMLQTGVCHFEKDRTIDVVTCSYDVFFTPDPLSAVYPVSALFKYRELNDHPLRGMFTLDPIDPNELETHPFSAILKASFPIHSCLVKKTSVGKARFPEDLETGEDSYFWLLLARKGCRFRFYPNIYAFYRRHSGNVTRTGRSLARGPRGRPDGRAMPGT